MEPPHVCAHSMSSSATAQTLSEMDFERGIWTAALNNDDARARELLAKDPRWVQARDSSDYTALHYAARGGYLGIMQLLLEHGADPNAATSTGHVTPLHRAAYMGHLPAVRLLRDHKADPSIQDSDGRTALHKSVEKTPISSNECYQFLASEFPELLLVPDYKGNCPPINK